MTEKTVKPELLIMVDRLARIGRAMQRARAAALRKAQYPDGQTATNRHMRMIRCIRIKISG